MFPSAEAWRSVGLLVIGGLIAALSLKLWEAEEKERRRRQDNFASESRNLPQEHDERS